MRRNWGTRGGKRKCSRQTVRGKEPSPIGTWGGAGKRGKNLEEVGKV